MAPFLNWSEAIELVKTVSALLCAATSQRTIFSRQCGRYCCCCRSGCVALAVLHDLTYNVPGYGVLYTLNYVSIYVVKYLML